MEDVCSTLAKDDLADERCVISLDDYQEGLASRTDHT